MNMLLNVAFYNIKNNTLKHFVSRHTGRKVQAAPLCLPLQVCRIILYALILLCPVHAVAGVESLKLLLQNAKHDTTRCNILNAMIEEESNDSVWIKYNDAMKDIAERNLDGYPAEHSLHNFYLGHLADAYNNYGYYYERQGKPGKALENYEKSLDMSKRSGNRSGVASTLNNLGYVYYSQADVSRALEHYMQSLAIYEEIGDQQGIARSYNNMAVLHNNQDNVDKGLEYLEKSLAIKRKLDDKAGIANMLLNMGALLFNKELEENKKNVSGLEDYKEAIKYFQEALEISRAIDHRDGEATALNNIGSIYCESGMLDEALYNLGQSLAIRQQLNDKQGIAYTMDMLAEAYLKKNELDKALDYGLKALATGKETGYPTTIRNAAQTLTDIYKRRNEPAKALESFELYITMRDSVVNQSTRQLALRDQLRYEYGRKVAADSVRVAEEKKVMDAKLSEEQTMRYALYGGLGLVMVFAGFISNRFRVTQKQKKLIEIKEQETHRQKGIIEEKQKEILDSINYARRIQAAILPPARIVKEHLSQSFIIYKPKDIVAGDFYWLEHISGKVLFAAADCTGHGVPGAMVSVVCNNGLNRSVREHGLTDPGRILDTTREIVIREFEKSDEDVKDGMDISLCALDKAAMQLQWAGANNPLWIVRGGELIEYKGDKQPIGKHELSKPFTTHDITLQAGDMIYIFSDGYIDQFGGANSKKFKAASLKKLLLSVYDDPIGKQQQEIENAFDQWKAGQEQVDDVCMIGVRI